MAKAEKKKIQGFKDQIEALELKIEQLQKKNSDFANNFVKMKDKLGKAEEVFQLIKDSKRS